MTTAQQWAVGVAREVASPAVVASTALPLAEFQADAARRLSAMIRQWGGALLADAVGLGKTRVAITVALTIAREQRIAGARGEVWLCVPARLAAAWHEAARVVGLQGYAVVTHAALSRGNTPASAPIAIVVDEAHRFRNADTARRRTLEAHANVPLLLLTATPIANSIDDLWRLLALFLDDDDVRRCFGWDLATARRLAHDGVWDAMELVREVTVRRTEPPEDGFGRRPSVELEVVPYAPSADEAWLWAHLESRLRALTLFDDGDDWPTGLFVEHVLRRWESGAHALRETTTDLLAYARRRLDAARSGRSLDRSDFRALFGVQPDQEVFAFLYPLERSESPSVEGLLADVERLRELHEHVSAVCREGVGRDDVLVELAQTGEPLLVFTSYRSAARGLYDRLVDGLGVGGRVGLITGTSARATGLGRVPAAEILRRFSPRSHGATLRAHEQIQVLVATDCISEGVNLQDCGRIVLADLPYSPLGIEQRVGRLVRPGGPHDTVRVLLLRPVNWNDSLGMRRRLQAKMQAAREVGFADTQCGPLAGLTAIERVALRDITPPPLPPAAAIVEEPTTWLVLARVSGRPWFFVVGGEQSFASRLAELAWDESAIVECAVPEVVTSVLANRERFLVAAHAAPPALALDAPEAAAWRVITGAAESLKIERSELLELRSRLIRGQRLGVRRQLLRLAHGGSPSRLLRYVRSLDAPENSPSVELVSALGI